MEGRKEGKEKKKQIRASKSYGDNISWLTMHITEVPKGKERDDI